MESDQIDIKLRLSHQLQAQIMTYTSAASFTDADPPAEFGLWIGSSHVQQMAVGVSDLKENASEERATVIQLKEAFILDDDMLPLTEDTRLKRVIRSFGGVVGLLRFVQGFDTFSLEDKRLAFKILSDWPADKMGVHQKPKCLVYSLLRSTFAPEFEDRFQVNVQHFIVTLSNDNGGTAGRPSLRIKSIEAQVGNVGREPTLAYDTTVNNVMDDHVGELAQDLREMWRQPQTQYTTIHRLCQTLREKYLSGAMKDLVVAFEDFAQLTLLESTLDENTTEDLFADDEDEEL